MDEDLTSWVSKFLKRETDTILVIMGDHGSTVNRFIKKVKNLHFEYSSDIESLSGREIFKTNSSNYSTRFVYEKFSFR